MKSLIPKTITVMAIALLTIQTTTAQTVTYKTGWVTDGDTVTLKDNYGEIKTRLAWIDTPEYDQELGEASKWYLINLLKANGNQVTAIGFGNDSYQRLLAELYDRNGKSINLQMVRSGMAFFYRKYCTKGCDKEAYNQAELEAKQNHRGVWNSDDVAPWVWRREKREKAQ
ncbi:MAG: thermonuclease family protein [Microcystaceae cyanobacterium]